MGWVGSSLLIIWKGEFKKREIDEWTCGLYLLWTMKRRSSQSNGSSFYNTPIIILDLFPIPSVLPREVPGWGIATDDEVAAVAALGRGDGDAGGGGPDDLGVMAVGTEIALADLFAVVVFLFVDPAPAEERNKISLLLLTFLRGLLVGRGEGRGEWRRRDVRRRRWD